MSEIDKKNDGPGVTNTNDASLDLQFEAVKQLLLSGERASIDDLNNRLAALEQQTNSDPEFSQRIAELLASSLTELDETSRKAVSVQLAGMLKEDIKNEISLSEPLIMQAIVPRFGALIRKGIQSEFEKLIAYIDDRLNGASSPIKRLEIRTKSLLSGRSEAEVWLETFPQYSLSSVLLVHRPTGMMIKSIRRERSAETGAIVPGGELITEGEGNEEMIAAMLSTIANFANDAFVDTNAGQLKTMDFDTGDLLLVSSPLVQLAVLVEGPMPLDLEARIERVFEGILEDHHEIFAKIGGEVEDGEDIALQNDLRKVLELSGDSDSSTSPSKTDETGLESVQKARPWWQRLWVWGVVFSGLVLLVLWLGSAFQESRRERLLARAQEAVNASSVLQSYPIDFQMDRGSDVMTVRGLLSHPSQIKELNDTLQAELPFLIFDSNVRTVWDETVSAQIASLNIKVVTNSDHLQSLDEEVTIQKSQGREFEAAIEVAKQQIDILRLGLEITPETFLTPPLGELRDEFASLVAVPGFGKLYPVETLPQSSINRMIAGLTILFDADGNLILPDQAFRAGQALSRVDGLRSELSKPMIVAVVRADTTNSDPNTVSDRMIESVRQVLLANDFESSQLPAQTMILPVITSNGSGEVNDEMTGWQTSNFIGFVLNE